jgi:anthranilate synthase component 2
MNKIIIIDNYDSFTYNLVHLVEKITNEDVLVMRNDEVNFNALDTCERIILSPGPGLPKNAGLMPDVISRYAGQKPILGVCLGHQAVSEYLGGKLYNLERVMHGIATPISITRSSDVLYKSVPDGILVGRYHSWAVDELTLPDDVHVTSRDATGCVMSIECRRRHLFGVQYHPESILSQFGEEVLSNFIQYHI